MSTVSPSAGPPTLPPPSEDKRWRIVNATMRRNGYAPSALIETLHSVQEAFGYLDDPALTWISRSLRIPLSKTYGVATFYALFRLKPPGEHACVVCMGTACYIQGASRIVSAITNYAGIKPAETTEDKKVSLLVARCLGVCGSAPVVSFDGQVAGGMSPSDAVKRIAEWMGHEH